MCVLAGARRVVLNDAWQPAIENVLLNLNVNKGLLGIDEILYPEESNRAVGTDSVLVALASVRGASQIEVYHGDLARLFSRAKPAEICLIDHFPGADTSKLEKACRSCNEVVLI
jgi:hypothetical protein